MKRVLALLLALLLLPATPAHAGTETLTLMVYLCGSNLESSYAAASADLLEMLEAGFDGKQIQLLVMAGGTEQWGISIPSDCLPVYQLRSRQGRGGSMVMVHAFEDMSMGSSEALDAFLSFAYEAYPADHYALILWDHGGGALEGLCMDTRHSRDTLSMAELCTALAGSPFAAQPLDWLGFDACLMASVETAALVAPYAQWMIASQEREPGCGWDYGFLADLDPAQGGDAAGRLIIDRYFDFAQGEELTLSCTDLRAVRELTEGISAFFSLQAMDEALYARRASLLEQLPGFGRAAFADSDYDLVDLGALLSSLPDPSLLSALERAVVYARSTRPGCTGLTVYHPFRNKSSFLRQWRSLYGAFQVFPGYASYVDRFAAYLLGSADVSWRSLRASVSAGRWALLLGQAQQLSFSSAAPLLLRRSDALDAYACVYAGLSDARTEGDVPLLQLTLEAPGVRLPVPFSRREDGAILVYVNYVRAQAATLAEASCALLPGEEIARGITIGGDDTPVAVPTPIQRTPAPSEGLQAAAEPAPIQTYALPALTTPAPGAGLSLTAAVQPYQPNAYAAYHGVPLSDFLEEQTVIGVDSIREGLAASSAIRPDVVHACLVCEADAGSGAVRIRERLLYDPSTGEYTSRLPLEARAYDYLIFPQLFRRPPEKADALPSFEQWTLIPAPPAASIGTADDWSLSLVPLAGTEGLYLTLSVLDVQRTAHGTPPLALP